MTGLAPHSNWATFGRKEPPPSFSFRDENERLRCWIVVFGFDARAEPRDVLEALGRYGEILEHEVGRGNWLFLRYATKW